MAQSSAWAQLTFPAHYPEGELSFLHRYVTGRNPDPQKPPRWQEWSDGVNGHVYRFLSCEEHFQEVTRSLSIDTAPPQPERYNQEKWLFGFFYEGLSSLECLLTFPVKSGNL